MGIADFHNIEPGCQCTFEARHPRALEVLNVGIGYFLRHGVLVVVRNGTGRVHIIVPTIHIHRRHLLMIGIPNGLVLVWCCTDPGLLFTKKCKGIGHTTTAWVLGILALAVVVMTMACIGLRSTIDRPDGEVSSLKYLAGDEYLWACFALSILSWVIQLLLLMYSNGQHKHRKAARSKSVEETSV